MDLVRMTADERSYGPPVGSTRSPAGSRQRRPADLRERPPDVASLSLNAAGLRSNQRQSRRLPGFHTSIQAGDIRIREQAQARGGHRAAARGAVEDSARVLPRQPLKAVEENLERNADRARDASIIVVLFSPANIDPDWIRFR